MADGRREEPATRDGDGAWWGCGGPVNKRVSAVLSTEGLTAWSLGQRSARLISIRGQTGDDRIFSSPARTSPVRPAAGSTTILMSAERGSRIYGAGLRINCQGERARPLSSQAPLPACQAPWLRSLAPIRPHVSAYHPAPGTHRPPVQVQEHRIIRPAVGVYDRTVMADPGGAVDQQSPDPMRADMAQGHRGPSIGLGATFSRRVVMGIAVSHQTRFLNRSDLANTAALIAARFLCRPCSICNGVSCSSTWPRSRISSGAPQFGHAMKCSASLSASLPRRLPICLPRGALTRRWVTARRP